MKNGDKIEVMYVPSGTLIQLPVTNRPAIVLYTSTAWARVRGQVARSIELRNGKRYNVVSNQDFNISSSCIVEVVSLPDGFVVESKQTTSVPTTTSSVPEGRGDGETKDGKGRPGSQTRRRKSDEQRTQGKRKDRGAARGAKEARRRKRSADR